MGKIVEIRPPKPVMFKINMPGKVASAFLKYSEKHPDGKEGLMRYMLGLLGMAADARETGNQRLAVINENTGEVLERIKHYDET